MTTFVPNPPFGIGGCPSDGARVSGERSGARKNEAETGWSAALAVPAAAPCSLEYAPVEACVDGLSTLRLTNENPMSSRQTNNTNNSDTSEIAKATNATKSAVITMVTLVIVYYLSYTHTATVKSPISSAAQTASHNPC